MSSAQQEADLPPHLLTRTDFVEACNTRDFAAIFRLIKKYAGYTNSKIARLLETTPGHIGKVINEGSNITAIAVIERAADGLHIPGALLGLAVRPWECRQEPQQGTRPDSSRDDSTGLRGAKPAKSSGTYDSLPINISDISGVLPFNGRQGEVEIPGFSATPAVRLDNVDTVESLCNFLAQLLKNYVSADNAFGSLHIISAVTLQLTQIKRYLEMLDGTARANMLGLAARYAEFAGWLFQDCGNYTAAEYWCDRAFDWARERDDRVMMSYILMRKSTLSSEMGAARRTLALSDAALAIDVEIPPRVRTLALRQKAHGYALLADEKNTRETINMARSVILQADNADDIDTELAGYCLGSYLDAEEASCLSELQQKKSAVTAFEQALSAWPDLFRRDKGLYVAKFAFAVSQVGDVERALTLANQATSLANSTGSARTIQFVRSTARALDEQGAHNASTSIVASLPDER